MKNSFFIFSVILFISIISSAKAQQASNKSCNVIAYYSGNIALLDSFDMRKITHIIFSFCHLKNDEFDTDNKKDSAEIEKMVSLKKINPHLKVLLSIGGWGGCETCSEIFSTEASRKTFALSVKNKLDFFHADGIDLDWEYPAIIGFPGHRFTPADRGNFTFLIIELRKTLGDKKEISFAAGGFKNYFDSSVEWNKVMPLVDRVNLMSYDLVNGYATVSGNHTPLYSTPQQELSVDYGVKYLDSLKVPLNKIAIGAAFYGRIFANKDSSSNGMYQATSFKEGASYKRISEEMINKNGFKYYWDDVAKAPFLYNAEKKYLVSFDDSSSISLKTKYTIDKKLNGIMFWELAEDNTKNGLLDVIDETKKNYK